jgi:hypothetical protein
MAARTNARIAETSNLVFILFLLDLNFFRQLNPLHGWGLSARCGKSLSKAGIG